MTHQHSYENLKADVLSAFDKYKTESKASVLSDKEIAALFNFVSSFAEQIEFSASKAD